MRKKKYKRGDLITCYRFENGNNVKIVGLIIEISSKLNPMPKSDQVVLFKNFYLIYVNGQKELMTEDWLDNHWSIVN
jgi:hypothetical protein